MKIQRTPQEKKRLSYEKDRRNSYGESHKSSFKAIHNRKRRANQTFRRKSKLFTKLLLDEKPDRAAGVLSEAKLKFKSWKKRPDKPLGKYLKDKGKL